MTTSPFSDYTGAPVTARQLAEQITRRLVENAIRLQFTRNDLALVAKADDDDPALDENEMVNDALNLALGDDTGCLSDEELNAENIDVLWVEQLMTAAVGYKDCLLDEIGKTLAIVDPASKAVGGGALIITRQHLLILRKALEIAAEEKLNDWSEADAEGGVAGIWTKEDEDEQTKEWIEKARAELGFVPAEGNVVTIAQQSRSNDDIPW